MSFDLRATICVPDAIKTSEIEGYLVFGYKNEYTILEEGEILILDRYDSEHIIASTAIDENGYFKIEGVKPGKYILSGGSNKLKRGVLNAKVEVNIVKPTSKKNSAKGEKMIFIVVGMWDGTNDCTATSVKIQPKSKIEAMLKDAMR